MPASSSSSLGIINRSAAVRNSGNRLCPCEGRLAHISLMPPSAKAHCWKLRGQSAVGATACLCPSHMPREKDRKPRCGCQVHAWGPSVHTGRQTAGEHWLVLMDRCPSCLRSARTGSRPS